MPNNLTKVRIVEKLHNFIGLSRSECSEILEDFFKIILKSLKEKNSVKIANFGSFTVKSKSQRIGRNPKTKEEVMISARKVVKFKPSKSIINKINKV